MKRREFLSILALSPLASISLRAKLEGLTLITKKIPQSEVPIPVIGMGTWITFNVGSHQGLREGRVAVLREFFRWGGGIIDSSPMYGSAEEVLGYALQ